jgi:FkbM family methyltransferase
MRFYGQNALDRALYERYFRDVRDGFFIEAGAFDGQFESTCKFFEQFMDWTGINIEPVPHLYEMCSNNRPNTRNLRIALSGTRETKKFTQAVHPGMGNFFGNGSLTHSDLHMNSLKRDGCKFEEFDVECITYNDLVVQESIQKIDLFVLDVEGHELQVLAGMEGATVLPEVFCIEHGHLGDALIQPLANLGYRLDHKHHVNSFFVRD